MFLRIRKLALLSSFALLQTFMAMTVSAQVVIRVDPVNGLDSNDGSSWTNDGPGVGPKQTIQAAIDDAAVPSRKGDNPSQVWLKKGTYQPASAIDGSRYSKSAVEMLSDVEVRGGFEGNEAVPGDRPPLDPFATIIDGSVADSGSPAFHVVSWESTTDTLLEGVAIMGGRGDVSGSDANGGGVAMYFADASNRLADCWIIDNRVDSASGSGGAGAYLDSSQPVFTDCLVAGNSAPDRFGGGIMTSAPTGSVDLRRCVLSGNFAGRGGAISHNGDGMHRMDRTIVAGNDASPYAGGLYIAGESTDRITNTLFVGNAGRGAVNLTAGIDVEFTNCTIADNTATSGGGIYAVAFGTPDPTTIAIRNTIFADNVSRAIQEVSDDLDITEITNCLFFGNNIDFANNLTENLNGADAINAAEDVDASGNIDGDPRFLSALLPTGQWESKSADGVFLTLRDNDPDPAPFVADEWVGRLIQVDTAEKLVLYVVANTADSVTCIAATEVQDVIGETASYAFKNYQLGSGSAARDAAIDFTAEAPATAQDFRGTARPLVSGFDIGAYEAPAAAGSGVTLSSDANPAYAGTVVTFTAMVAGTGGPVSGDVEFHDGLDLLGTATIDSGSAQFATGDLAVGGHTITARYPGDFINGESVSDPLLQTIDELPGDLMAVR